MLAHARGWLRRATELRAELAAIAEDDPRWWVVAGGAALAEPFAPPEVYLACDAEPDGDTFMGFAGAPAIATAADAIAFARAARTALRELDGTLPDQPLAVTVESAVGAALRPSAMAIAAFALGDRVIAGALDDPRLAARLATAFARTDAAPDTEATDTPFVCVSIGDEPIETARHGHRRAWTPRGGPWLGIGRSGDLTVVSTCHLVVDGYGHARIAARIAELVGATSGAPESTSAARGESEAGLPPESTSGARGESDAGLLPESKSATSETRSVAGMASESTSGARSEAGLLPESIVEAGLERVPAPARVPGTTALAVAWRPLPGLAPRVIPLAYEVGRVLHRNAGRPEARFSPTIQIPVARGRRDDPMRLRRRVVSATTSVRFVGGVIEPYAEFAARTRAVIAREADATGLVSRLLAAARAVPVPLAWKRRSIGAQRARWLEGFAEVIGGRALLSRIAIDTPIPALCAVSTPSRLASARDPIGGCVITIVDDGSRAAITVSGSGFAGTTAAADALLDEVLAACARHA